MKRSTLMGIGIVALATGSVAIADMADVYLPLFLAPPLRKRIEDPDKPASKEKIDLGRMLYFEPRLSLGQNISCNTCHPLDKYGADGKKTSPGHKGQLGTRNSPTVYNTAGHFKQFWDYRADTVEDQATKPVLNPVEMAMPDEKYVLQVLKSIPGYVDAFKKAFPQDAEPVTYENVGNAIGAFERGLTTPAPWDKYLDGDKSAMTSEQVQGFNDFLGALCMTCHMGRNVGGAMPQKLGVVLPWPNQNDKGRFEVTKNPAEAMFFKVPSLRNIAKTAPYFHDGSQDSLEEAVKMMAKHQSGLPLSDEKVKSIVAFLNALTGELPQDYIKAPVLPPGGPNTPKPKLD